jgi:hypothetical protein
VGGRLTEADIRLYGKLVRTIGLARTRMKIGMQNLAYDMCRFVHLQLMPATPA